MIIDSWFDNYVGVVMLAGGRRQPEEAASASA